MGYSTRNNGQIRDFTPDDTKDEFYILGSASMEEIMNRAKQHFGENTWLNDISIRGERIHTRCLTYDLYDPSDYDDYLIISKKI